MSFVKRFTEHHEYHKTLVSVLRYLDENNLLPGGETQEIAKRIINGQKPDDLDTSSQRWSFYNHIEPLLKNISCEASGCNAKIGVSGLELAFTHERQYDALLCLDCLVDRWRH